MTGYLYTVKMALSPCLASQDPLMQTNNFSGKLSFQFLSEPTDVNFGGKVHGGAVMKWIDQTAFACAGSWCESYCVTVYVGGIRFYKPIKIGEMVRVDAAIIYTGNSSMHIAIDVFSKNIVEKDFQKTTHCIIVFVAVDAAGNKMPVPRWQPVSEQEKMHEQYALRLIELRKKIEEEMAPFYS